ncbi:MAG: polyisoprenoid-binding protein [Alphaproteobacteria bacterium]|jgi:polyisoprenoid-binding protein YceI|nr:polyisoprenoid-binding protein [Alphaproteobacteria bacterium]
MGRVSAPFPRSTRQEAVIRKLFLAAGSAALLTAGIPALLSSAPADAAPGASAAAAQVAPPARSGSYALDRSHAKIIWSVSHFGFSTYYGEFTDFDARLILDAANPERSRLNVTVNTPSVATHNDALDTHLRNADFFGVADHPTATFNSTAIRRTGATTAEVTGDFTMLGRTRPLTLDVTFNAARENMAGVYTAGFSATGTIKRSDYGMNYALPAVGDEVALQISGEFNLAS